MRVRRSHIRHVAAAAPQHTKLAAAVPAILDAHAALSLGAGLRANAEWNEVPLAGWRSHVNGGPVGAAVICGCEEAPSRRQWRRRRRWRRHIISRSARGDDGGDDRKEMQRSAIGVAIARVATWHVIVRKQLRQSSTSTPAKRPTETPATRRQVHVPLRSEQFFRRSVER